MTHVTLGRRGAIVLAVIVLAGCAPQVGTQSPRPTATATATESPSPRFLIDCFFPDGSAVGTFTRLEEAWASTNYVRIDHCEARAGASGSLELTSEEAAVAEVAARDLPDVDPVDLFLRTLAACVRIVPDGDHGFPVFPTSILEAALELCPEAPHAGLIQNELDARG